jgi:hypothetical protein
MSRAKTEIEVKLLTIDTERRGYLEIADPLEIRQSFLIRLQNFRGHFFG